MISEKIKYLRKDVYNMTQGDLSKMLNVSRSTINNWETTISTPTINNVVLIATIFNVSTDYLIINKSPEELSLRLIKNIEQYNVISEVIEYINNKNELKYIKYYE